MMFEDWQSLSCVMTGSHVTYDAIRAWSCSSRLGSTFLQKDLELLQLADQYWESL